MENREQNGQKPNLDAEQKRQWDENHKNILHCVHRCIQSNYQTPTIAYIAEQTGLSRPTVYKHLSEFSATDGFEDHAAIYKLMSTSVLRALYSHSMHGSVGSARLYMQLIGVMKGGALVENNFLSNALNPKPLTPEERTQQFLDSLTPSLRETLQSVIKEKERREKEKEALMSLQDED
jgi:DNA-binding phage protein